MYYVDLRMAAISVHALREATDVSRSFAGRRQKDGPYERSLGYPAAHNDDEPRDAGRPPDDLDARSRIAVHRRRFATRFPTETADDK